MIKLFMIAENKLKKALQAIQDLIIEARILAYENISNKDIAEFLDSIEYLPALIIEEKDRTQLFENYLYSIFNTHNCLNVIKKYRRR